VFKALADPHRVQIVSMLALTDEEYSVNAIAEWLGVGQSHTSYHLKQLADAGVIGGIREGNYVWYQLVDGALEKLASLFGAPTTE
jgi:ArsR family transcriptional regulator